MRSRKHMRKCKSNGACPVLPDGVLKRCRSFTEGRQRELKNSCLPVEVGHMNSTRCSYPIPGDRAHNARVFPTPFHAGSRSPGTGLALCVDVPKDLLTAASPARCNEISGHLRAVCLSLRHD